MTATALLERAHDGTVSDDELAKPKRRNFTAAYKLTVLKQYEALDDPGAKGAFLRREGLYSSHIVEWRRAREAGALAELAPKVRRSKAGAEHQELVRAQRKIARLEDQLDRHRKALEIQGKASELLAKLLAESGDDH
jgi:transposase-like protein